MLYQGESTQREERSKRQERAHRILNAAAELVQRWGYKKTTIDDIAKQAHVAKGTIYLHWKNREDLFIALFLRESLEAADAMVRRMQDDPEGFLLHNFTKHAIYVTMKRPLIKALYVGDIELLGELAHSVQPMMVMLMQRKLIYSEGIFELLRSKDIIRTDMSIPKQSYMYSAIVMGFLTVEAYLPEQYLLSIEEAVEGLAETIKRTFGPDKPVASEALEEVRTQLLQLFQQYLAFVREQVQKEMDL